MLPRRRRSAAAPRRLRDSRCPAAASQPAGLTAKDDFLRGGHTVVARCARRAHSLLVRHRGRGNHPALKESNTSSSGRGGCRLRRRWRREATRRRRRRRRRQHYLCSVGHGGARATAAPLYVAHKQRCASTNSTTPHTRGGEREEGKMTNSFCFPLRGQKNGVTATCSLSFSEKGASVGKGGGLKRMRNTG